MGISMACDVKYCNIIKTQTLYQKYVMNKRTYCMHKKKHRTLILMSNANVNLPSKTSFLPKYQIIDSALGISLACDIKYCNFIKI